jgi:organic radical activating enzyme
MTARIVEIFHSLQGEGIHLGEPTTFVRFAGCNLDCVYCDTPQGKDSSLSVEMNLQQALDKIMNVTGQGQFVSLTGGEPLLQAGFIQELAPLLRGKGYRIYLETNGTLPEKLEKVIGDIDVVAMDIKPPSACSRDHWKEQQQFLETAKGKVFVKLVVCDNTSQEEVERAASITGRVDSNIVMILQPAEGSPAPDMQMVRRFQTAAGEYLGHVSIIRQMHKLWGIP